MKESVVQKKIMKWLKEQGAYTRRVNSGKIKYEGRWIILGVKGTPDIAVTLNGHSIGVEVKKDAKELQAWNTQFKNWQKTGIITAYNERSYYQHREQNKIREAGGYTFTVYSVDMLEKELKEFNLL